MHRRRGNPADGGGGAPRRSPPARRSGRSAASAASGAGLALLLVASFAALMAVEFAAYRMLGGTPPPSNSNSKKAGSAIGGAPINAAVGDAGDAGDTDDANDPLPEALVRSPTRRPATFEPTNGQVGWRVKEARRANDKGVQFWKTHVPDPLPPLPPDVVPETGEDLPPVVAYVVTLTKCGPKHRGGLDGAAVLLHSIRRNSYGWVPMEDQMEQSAQTQTGEEAAARPKYGGRGGRYRYRAYVIVDPSASPHITAGRSGECARFLQKIGYTVLHRPPLVPLFELPDEGGDGDGDGNGDESPSHYDELRKQGYVGMRRPPSSLRAGERPDKLRKFIHNDGCCGYTEMLKLHVYGMVEHELAVHLDFDSLLLRPMDDLFDAMLAKGGAVGGEGGQDKLPLAKLPKTKEVDLSRPIDAAFTRDYNSINRPRPDGPVGYQGGFLVVRPSLDVLERYRDILRRGDFLLGPRDGWEGKVGGFYGDATFQGVLPYYYEIAAPREGAAHNEAELDRCVFNQMADNPRKSTYKFPRATPLDAKKMGFRDTKICRDGREDCSDTDCQRVHPKDSITTHFTFCKKPWDCSEGNAGTVASPTCLGLLREWYAVRRELEDWWSMPSPNADSAGASTVGGDGWNNQRSFYREDKTISKVKESRTSTGELDVSQYLGYCDAIGTEGYHRLVEPDGLKKQQ